MGKYIYSNLDCAKLYRDLCKGSGTTDCTPCVVSPEKLLARRSAKKFVAPSRDFIFFLDLKLNLFHLCHYFCRPPENIYLKLISVIRKYFLHGIKKKGKFIAEIIIISRLFHMGLLFIVFKAGLIINTWEFFCLLPGKRP